MLVSNNYFEIKKNILDFSIWRNLSSRKIRRSNQSCLQHRKLFQQQMFRMYFKNSRDKSCEAKCIVT